MKLSPEQLKSLSKEEKLKLLELIEEKKRRLLDARPAFKPHPGQLKVILSQALEKYLFCGNGFGKSTLLVNEVHWAATGYNPITGEHTPVPAKICLVLDDPAKIDDFITEYRKWHKLEERQLHKKGKPNYSFIDYDTGSTVSVISHEVNDLKVEGSQWTHIFMDEPPPKHIFTGLLRGGRIKGRPVKIFLAGTPIKAAWLRTDIYEPWTKGALPECECFTGETDENRDNLEEGWFRRFFGKLSEKEQRIRRKGLFFDLDGLALAHLWREDEHLVEWEELAWDPNNPCVLVMDPHPSKAHHAIVLGVDDANQLYVVAEYKEKVLARHFMRNLIEEEQWFTRFRITDIVYDSLGSSETTSGEGYRSFGEVVNEVLEEHELGRARATTYAEKDDEEWIERIKDVLVIEGEEPPKLRFVRGRAGGTVADIKNVQWKQDKLKENAPKLDITHKDFLSCLKYALACNLFYDKPRRQRAHYVRKRPYGLALAKGTRASAPRKPGTLFLSRRKRPRPEADNDDDW